MIQNCKVIGDGVSNEIYRKQADGVKRGDPRFIMGRGEIVDFALNPWKWLRKEDDDSTAATDYGSLMDCLLTRPSEFDDVFAIMPETYVNSRREVKEWTMRAKSCKEWVADKRAQGMMPIHSSVLEKAKLAVDVVRSNQDVMEILRISQKQVFVTGEWKDDKTGLIIPLRTLIDILPPADHMLYGKWMLDFKTARNGDPQKWARVCDDEGYDVQAALYMDLYMMAKKEERLDWVHIVQENTHPYHLITPLPEMTSEFIEWGRKKYQLALDYYCQCLAANNWPSYQPTSRASGKIQFIDPGSLFHYRQTIGSGNPALEFMPAALDEPEEKKDEPERIDNDV